MGFGLTVGEIWLLKISGLWRKGKRRRRRKKKKIIIDLMIRRGRKGIYKRARLEDEETIWPYAYSQLPDIQTHTLIHFLSLQLIGFAILAFISPSFSTIHGGGGSVNFGSKIGERYYKFTPPFLFHHIFY